MIMDIKKIISRSREFWHRAFAVPVAFKPVSFLGAHPRQYWARLLGAAAIIIAVSIVGNILLFVVFSRDISNARFAGGGFGIVAVDRALLERALKTIGERRAAYERAAERVVADPSL